MLSCTFGSLLAVASDSLMYGKLASQGWVWTVRNTVICDSSYWSRTVTYTFIYETQWPQTKSPFPSQALAQQRKQIRGKFGVPWWLESSEGGWQIILPFLLPETNVTESFLSPFHIGVGPVSCEHASRRVTVGGLFAPFCHHSMSSIVQYRYHTPHSVETGGSTGRVLTLMATGVCRASLCNGSGITRHSACISAIVYFIASNMSL